MSEQLNVPEHNYQTNQQPTPKGHERWSWSDRAKTIGVYTGAGLLSSLVLCGYLHSLIPQRPEIFTDLCLTSTAIITGLSCVVGISESNRMPFS